jgi:RNA polymerase sigma-70 factor, ECF subfamily
VLAAPDLKAGLPAPADNVEQSGPVLSQGARDARSWIEGLLYGSVVDFDSVFNDLYPSLYRYLHRLTGDADVAEDVAQEAFMRLLRQELPEDEIRPWLFTVAMNLVRDRARKSERRQRLLTTAPSLVTRLPLPDEDMEQAERITAVRAVLERIPERDRQLLLMREEGFKYDEIARVIGVAPASVGTLIARALKKFAAAFDARESVDDPRD